jgi:hypothetical protein
MWSMRVRLILLAAVIVAFGAAAPRAHAQAAKDLWATVNVCDTPKSPDAIGIRASMPGLPRGTRLAMRFRVQYQVGATWKDVAGANSGWRFVGLGHATPVESGWSFTFADPTSPVTLRGMVQFRWRRNGVVVRSAQLATEAGHRSSAGADPADYSAASCTLGS